MTCHHVLAERCGSLFCPDPPNRAAYGDYANGFPDAALIQLQSGCFVDPGQERRPIACATAADRERAIAGKLSVVKSPDSGYSRGQILHVVQGVSTDDHGFSRGPHLQIIPHRTRRFGMDWPPGRHPFSRTGHSGSWVSDESSSVWYGMISSGIESAEISYALEASYLLDLMSLQLRLRQPLETYRLT